MTTDFDRAFPRGHQVQHGEVTKFRVLGLKVCDGKSVIGKCCFAGLEFESIPFERESRLNQTEDHCFE
jgi:hypothetical protein